MLEVGGEELTGLAIFLPLDKRGAHDKRQETSIYDEYGDDGETACKFPFDEHGRPPPNAPLEDIVEERQKIEYEILWVEGVLLELRHRLIKVKEVEDYALEMLSRASPED